MGIEHDFHTGMDETASFVSAQQNMQSAKENPKIVEEYLIKEATKGNILGPFSPDIAPHVHINRIGAIPKKYQQGKWRLITDLSSPEGCSINDAISQDPVFIVLHNSGGGSSNCSGPWERLIDSQN